MEPLLIVKVCNAHHIVDTYLYAFILTFLYLGISTHIQALKYSSYCCYLFIRIHIDFYILEPLLTLKIWNAHHIVDAYLYAFVFILISWNLYSYSGFEMLIILLTLNYMHFYLF